MGLGLEDNLENEPMPGLELGHTGKEKVPRLEKIWTFKVGVVYIIIIDNRHI